MKLRNRRFVASVDRLEERQLLSTMFSVKDLGLAIQVNGINASGQIVGTTFANQNVQATRFDPNGSTMTIQTGNVKRFSFGTAINDSGDIAGYILNQQNSTPEQAFVYSNGILIDLGTLGGYVSRATGIDKNNNVVGYSDVALNTDYEHAFIYSGDTEMDLGTLGGMRSQAHAISQNGYVTGSASDVDGYVHPFIQTVNRQMRMVGDKTFGYSIGYAVNNLGQVVGESDFGGNTQLHAFLSDPNGGTMHDLGVLDGSSATTAFSVNNHGDVVGEAAMDGTSVAHAFFYDGHTMHDLNSLIPSGSGWTIQSAKGINDNDQIAATATDASGQGHALLLTLIPPPSTSVSHDILWINNYANPGSVTTISLDPEGPNILVTTGDVIQTIPKGSIYSLCYYGSSQGHDTMINTSGIPITAYGYGDGNTFMYGAWDNLIYPTHNNVWVMYGNNDTVKDNSGTNIIFQYGGPVTTLGTGTFYVW